MSMNRNKPLNHIPEEQPLWSDKKRPFFGLPLSFTRYTLYTDRLIIESGLLFRRHDEIRLYRVRDLKMNQGPLQQWFGVGNVILMSSDVSSPRFILSGILQPYDVFRTISDLAESERRRVGVGVIESFPHEC